MSRPLVFARSDARQSVRPGGAAARRNNNGGGNGMQLAPPARPIFRPTTNRYRELWSRAPAAPRFARMRRTAKAAASDIVSNIARVLDRSFRDPIFLFTCALTIFLLLNRSSFDSSPLGRLFPKDSKSPFVIYVRAHVDKLYAAIAFIPTAYAAPPTMRVPLVACIAATLFFAESVPFWDYAFASIAVHVGLHLRIRAHSQIIYFIAVAVLFFGLDAATPRPPPPPPSSSAALTQKINEFNAYSDDDRATIMQHCLLCYANVDRHSYFYLPSERLGRPVCEGIALGCSDADKTVERKSFALKPVGSNENRFIICYACVPAPVSEPVPTDGSQQRSQQRK